MSTSSVGSSGTMIDVQGIVSKLMSLESRPLSVLQGRVQTTQTSISAMGQLLSLVDNAYSAANAMQDGAMLASKAVSVTDSSIVKVSVSDSGQVPSGSFKFEALEFARSQRTVFYGASANAVSDPSVARGSERLHLFNNNASSALGAFDVTLDFSGSSLKEIRDQINSHDDLKGKLSASVVRRADANGVPQDYVLVINGLATGADAGFTADWTSFGADPMTRDEPASSGFGAYGSQSARNALANVNGVAVGSSSNTFNEAVPGLSIEALKVRSGSTSAEASMTVSDNRAAFKERAQRFATALSDLNKKVRELTKPASDGVAAGPLSSNSAVLSISAGIFSSYVGGFSLKDDPSTTHYWNKLGFDYARDGSVSFSGSKLDQLMDDSSGFGQRLFAGFTSSIHSTLGSFRGVSGAIQSGINVMQSRLSELRSNQTDTQAKLEARQKLLLSQYAALDARLVGMGQQRNNVISALGSLSA